MAFTPEEIEYYHDSGLMPDWAWVQQNGKSAQWNFEYQRKKIYDQIKKREKIKRKEEIKKQIEQQIYDAIAYTMSEGAGSVVDAAAEDLVSSIDAAFNGGKINAGALKNKSFSAELGAMLGRALGQAPFKLLDELFEDDD